ncbi:MAG: flagellar basal body L-ring protein FlgH [Phycisphaerae bacterium]
MNLRRLVSVVVIITSVATIPVLAQTSSIGARRRQAEVGKIPEITPREAPKIQRNAIYESHSWITVRPAPPKTFKVGDLLTIIVRESRKFEADADLETKKQFDIKSELDAFFKLAGGGLGDAAFRRGKPNVGYKYNSELKNEGDTRREDRLTMRLTGKIIDVKPNGLLVIEAGARVQHDDEISTITFTGTCRKEDVTADNTVLSTQVADKNVVVKNDGVVRDASRRGWIPRLIDLVRPF